MVHLIGVGLVAGTVIHGEPGSPAPKPVALRSKLLPKNCVVNRIQNYIILWGCPNLPVAVFTEHLSVMLGDAAGVEQLPAVGAGEAELVVHVPQRLHLLREVDILLTPRTHSRHGPGRILFWKR